MLFYLAAENGAFKDVTDMKKIVLCREKEVAWALHTVCA